MAARRWPIRCAGHRPDLQIRPPTNCKYDGPRGCLAVLACLGGRAGQWLRRERVPSRHPHLRHKRGWLSYEPLGVVAIVSPWNFPFSIPFTQAATAVAAGNAAVVKPAELTPLSGA